MSMMDETPNYFISEGKIWSHHEGSEYTSGGFTEYEPSWNSELCEATPRNIKRYAGNRGLYSYDEHKYVQPIESNFKDAFGKEILEGDEVYTIDTDYSDRFFGFLRCKVVGFTKNFVKLKVIWFDETLSKHQINQIRRISERLIRI